MLACRYLHRQTYTAGGQFELVPLFAVFLIFYSIGMLSVYRSAGMFLAWKKCRDH